MTIENDALREEILVQMKSPQFGVPEYSADPMVLRRVGRALSELSARSRALGEVSSHGAEIRGRNTSE